MVKIPIAGGTGTTFTAFILGILPNFSHEAKDEIVFWFQVLAFAISIIVGALTATNIICKLKDRLKK